MKVDKTTLKKFYTEQIAVYIVPQTRDVFITAINICQLHISLANNVYCTVLIFQPIPATARSKAWVCGPTAAEIVGSNPPVAWMCVCCECCVFSDRGLCDELITGPEESYRLWCVFVCHLETS